MLKGFFGKLQRIGQALMLPVAILPAAGFLLAVGFSLKSPTVLEVAPFLSGPGWSKLATMMASAGGVVFDNLALLFAVGVAVGLAGLSGVAALASIVCYLVMNATMSAVGGFTVDMVLKGGNPSYALVVGIPTLQTGVFGGIICGLVGAWCYERFYKIELPQFLGFFAGKRFVPIASAFAGFLLGVAMFFLWPFAQKGLNSFSNAIMGSAMPLAVFLFGMIKRLLIPFGLHHIFYAPFWFEFGQYKTLAGEIVHGDLKIFFAQLKDGVPLTAGFFLGGEFPIMMFGLPAAALAMYHNAKPENKKMVAGLLASAALTSFLTGITEPIEFAFLFASPLLYLIHAALDGLSFLLLYIFKVHLGYTFSGGAIDFVLFGILPGREKWWIAVLLGLCFAVAYYVIFTFFIRLLDLKTPGREDAPMDSNGSSSKAPTELAAKILEALGGAGNLERLDACITRLRISVKDPKAVDKEALKALGATGVMQVDRNFQAIFGTASEAIKEEILHIAGRSDGRRVKVASPMSGKVVDLSEVPDKTFSERMVGEGFAVIPTDGLVVSPVDGKVTLVFPTMHAVGITSVDGLEVLVHVGIDTVKLNGEGFKALVSQGDEVKKGQPLIEADLKVISAKAPSIVTPVVFTNVKGSDKVTLFKGDVKAGENGANVVL
ncbi:MAG: glucose-specific PTS transporter subunit IIBC [Thermanaerothrix sp.]|nr:glucose-specific PTS transporter subunit IIBC [Thermanaerothrix sp.]